MAENPIPQTDPRATYHAQKSAIDAAIARVLESGWYILGKEVGAFETEFAAFIGAGQGIGVANGTDALEIALRALQIGPGDRVVTVSHTAVATVAAIELVGAQPVLVDIEPATYTMDPADLARVLKDHAPVKAVIPVHLYGQPAALPEIVRLCRAAGAAIIEDCSQSHGASLDGRTTGRFGDIATFSLYPTKNLGAIGDGGIVTTDDAPLAARLRQLREYGWKERYISAETGLNTRLDELQAAILRVKLGTLAADNARRAAIAAAYDAGLAGTGLTLPALRPGAAHVYHQYVVRTPHRDQLRERLKAAGVMTNIHYPVPVHLQPAYRGRIASGPSGLAETERAAGEILSLPMFPQMTDEQVRRVITAVAAAARMPQAAE